MSLVDELARLEEMRARGSLSEDDFQRAKQRLIDAEPAAPAAAAAALNRLRRSRSGQWLGGVCAWIWRLLFALLFIFGGTGLLIYLLLWIFVPLE